MIPPDLIVSVSGIRGIVGESLTPEIACRFAAALGTYLGGGRVVVGRDSRPSGEMLKHAVFAGLGSVGCTAEDIGIASTPTVGIAVRETAAAGGVQITASHNASPWNGLKMFGPDGAVLPAACGAEVRGLFESGELRRARWDGIGEVRAQPDPLETHLRLVLDRVSPSRIASVGLKVLVDGNGGAGGPMALKLLAELGVAVAPYNCESDGRFAHEPEPTPVHLADVAPWVPQLKCAIGFALDPDADRLALIDETGKCLSEEVTLALAVRHRLAQERGSVVVNMSTSRMVADIAATAGCNCYRTAVGEANVVEGMRAYGAAIGGEGNGGVIDPAVGWVRDPFIGMASILNLMADERKTLSELVAELPRYEMRKTKATVARDSLAKAYAALEKRWPQARFDRIDGLRLDGEDWWLHVRASNTEPIVRIIAEAPTAEKVESLCAEAAGILSS